MKRKKFQLTPVERAVARQKWSSKTLDAHLQALAGENWATVVDRVATLFYIVGLAAFVENMEADTDLRILHGAARTTLDISMNHTITPLQRGSLEAGLLAIERIVPRLSDGSMMFASIELQKLLALGNGVHWRDFEVFVK